MTRVCVDTSLCSANAVCVGVAPKVFALRGDDLLILTDPLDPDDLPEVTTAVDSCPTGALYLK
jgi:ferredoxin